MMTTTKPIEYERRTVKEWLLALLDGSLALPRFQRSYVWTDRKTSDLIMALLKGHPVGTMLLIDRYSEPVPTGASQEERRSLERFVPRSLAGAPTGTDLGSCRELILDGQQRLTSLWRALELGAGTGLEEIESHGRHAFMEVKDIRARSLNPVGVRWPQKRKAGILRVNPQKASLENLIPLQLFDPRAAAQHGPDGDPLLEWCGGACADVMSDGINLWWRISEQLRSRLLGRNIWYAKLPPGMDRSQAIRVFVKVNESSAVIRKFDIAVAQYDQGTGGRSLRHQISEWAESNAYAEAFFGPDEEKMIPKVGELILKVACLQEKKAPTDKQYVSDEVLGRLRDQQKLATILEGIEWTFAFLAEERIWRDKHLPSAVPLRVLPALFPQLHANADSSDLEGKTRRCLRAYLWRAFVTERYNQAANTRLKEDYDRLKQVLEALKNEAHPLKALCRNVPIFSSSCRLPEEKSLHDIEDPIAPPTRKNALSRSLLVASLHRGAKDFGSGETVSAANVGNREAHHLFPKGFIKHSVESKQVNHCLNYALVSGPTNKKIAAKPPLLYLRDRYKQDADLTEAELKGRLESHVIPYRALAVKEGVSAKANPDQIREAYADFLKARAKDMSTAINRLAIGQQL